MPAKQQDEVALGHEPPPSMRGSGSWINEAEAFLSEEGRTAKIVRTYAWVVLLVAFFNLLLMLPFPMPAVARFMTASHVVISAVPTLLLLRWKKIRAAAYWIVTVSWSIIAVNGFILNSPSRVSINWVFLVLSIAAITLGRRATIVFGALTVVLNILLYFSNVNQWFPETPLQKPLASTVVLVQQSIVWPIVLWVTISVFRQGLVHLENNLATLQETTVALQDEVDQRCRAEVSVSELNEELRTINSELESRVQTRTEQLRQANTDLEMFAARISHDLRAPLRSINGFATILKEDEPNLTDDSKQMLDRIQKSSVHMSEMIDAVLRFARVGREGLRIAPVDLNEIIRASLDVFLAHDDGSNLKIHCPKLPTIEADPILLRQALDNLIGNAIKFSATSPRPELWFQSSEEDGRFCLEIHDNGIGFPEGDPNKVFEPFLRLHGKEYDGVGLGLATVKRIVELHGGSIEAMKSNLGSAAFKIRLPRHASAAVETPA
ncbi:MAG: hypothetical protein BGO01_08485 [Armatimonadetes bacterium 55-13]|nr:HAMP domain-containing histidine kinase [Armatimonadota bacterium]OJU62504.1 MAG: hypothetical protein BGO01_08485 [Armatimonadetes bacterium 55-13]